MSVCVSVCQQSWSGPYASCLFFSQGERERVCVCLSVCVLVCVCVGMCVRCVSVSMCVSVCECVSICDCVCGSVCVGTKWLESQLAVRSALALIFDV